METSDILWDHEGTHPPEEILERYAMGRTSEEESERVEEHVFFCKSCQKSLNDSADWVKLMKAASAPVEEVNAAALLPGGRAAPDNWFSGVRTFWSRIPGPMYAGAFAAIAVAYLAAPTARSIEPQYISVSALRGNDLRVEVRAGKPTELTFDEGENLDGARASLVTADGAEMWSGTVRAQKVQTPELQAGSYWVRLYNPQGEQIKEYGIVAGSK